MKHSSEEKEDLYSLIFSELKALGVKIPKIKKCKLGTSKQVQYTNFKAKIFGVNLSDQEWITENECTLPKFLSATINYLHDYTKAEIGLFRKAGSVARQRNLRAKLESGGNLDGSEPNDVASLLKQWLRELPEPLIPCQLHDLFTRCQNLDAENARLSAVLLACLLLPCEHLYTLKHLFLFLSEMAANSEKNKMVPYNLALIMAPNILSPNCDRSDCKAGSDLVQSHTALVELLILNADKIGEIPPDVSTKLSLKFGELESSVEISNCSPSKLKKRRKGTGVIDIMCGIRRFVGGNIAHIPDDALEMSEFQPNQIPELGLELRSAPKRKANHDACDSSEKIRKPVFGINSEVNETWLLTPVGVKPHSLAIPIATHSNVRARRKSFGLLRKKYHKRGKSGAKFATAFKHASPLISVLRSQLSNEIKEPDSKVQGEASIMDTLNVTKSIDPKIMASTSPILKINNPVIKRALSDCNINVKSNEMTLFPKYISSSYSDLTKKRSSSRLKASFLVKRHSPRTCSDEKCLIHAINVPSYKRKSSKVIGKYLDLKSQNKNQVKGMVPIRSNSWKSPNVESEISKNLELSDLKINVRKSDSCRYTNIKSTASDFKISPSVNQMTVNISPCPKPNDISVDFDAINILNSNEYLNLSSEYLTPNCQQNHKLTEGNKELDRLTKENKELDCKLFETSIINVMDNSNGSVKSLSVRKGANKHSIRRGRPNTIKTGLPSDKCPKYTDIISSSFSDVDTPMFDENNETKNKKRHSSPNFIFPEESVFDDSKIQKSLMKEIYSCTKDTNLSSPYTALNTWLDFTQLEIKQNETCNDSIVFKTPMNNTKANRKKSLDDTSIRIRKVSKLSNTYSFEDLANEHVSSKEQSVYENINIIPPTPSPPNIATQTNENLKSKDFKIEDEIWMSAKKFLKTHLHSTATSTENLKACKRESIIQLMIKNAGKVQASVQLYNGISNKSPPCHSNHISDFSSPCTSATPKIKSRSMSLHESTTEKIIQNENKLSRRRLQSLKTNKEPTVDIKFNLSHKESPYKSPITGSPKIYIDNHSPVSGCPLREVTNISKNDSFKKNSSPLYH